MTMSRACTTASGVQGRSEEGKANLWLLVVTVPKLEKGAYAVFPPKKHSKQRALEPHTKGFPHDGQAPKMDEILPA